MEVTTTEENPIKDRASELKAFDDTKAGVKGLVDAGLTKIPRIFYHPPDHQYQNSPNTTQFTVPFIDLEGIFTNNDPIFRKEIVTKIKDASKTWGFFQVVNHGIPVSVLEEMKNGVRRFYEQDTEVKRELYSRDPLKPFVYNSNFNLYSGHPVDWRDTFYSFMAPNPPKPEDLPIVCR